MNLSMSGSNDNSFSKIESLDGSLSVTTWDIDHL